MSSRRQIVRGVVVALVIAVAVFAQYKAIRVALPLWSLGGRVGTLGAAVWSARDHGISEDTVHGATSAVRGIHQDLVSLYGEFVLAMPALRNLGWVPVVGGDLAALPDLAEVSLRVTDAAAIVTEALDPFAANLADSPALRSAEDRLATLLKAVPSMQPALARAQAQMDAAAAASARMDRASLSPWMAGLVSALDSYLPLLQLAVAGTQAAPDLLGADGPRTYLLLAQNSDELRATGGYIGGVGVLTVNQGRITDLKFLNTYGVDDLRQYYPDPPADLRATMLADQWLFRDGNWSPDFPTSARTLMMLYEKGQKRKADGVITLDLYAVQMMIGAMGPLQVEGFNEPVTGENAVDLIRRAWEPKSGQLDPEWYQHHKDFMSTVSQAILDRVRNNPASLVKPQVAAALERALREKHILVYLPQPQMARFLAEHGWDGAFLPADGDFLAVVDANVGFNKASPLVDERIAYRVELGDPSAPRAEVALSYGSRAVSGESPCVQENTMLPTYREMMNRCYWGYVRLYAPGGSTLTDATSAPLPDGSLLAQWGGGRAGQDTTRAVPEEAGKPGWGAFFVLPPQASRDLVFAYALPATVMQRASDGTHYDLWVQKQPGTDARPVTVTVVLPPGARLVAVHPRPTTVQNHVVTFEFRLSEDRHVEVRYEPAPE